MKRHALLTIWAKLKLAILLFFRSKSKTLDKSSQACGKRRETLKPWNAAISKHIPLVFFYSKWFEPRSISSSYCVIVWVRVSHQLGLGESPTTVLFRTTLTQTITQYELLILLGSNHLLCSSLLRKCVVSFMNDCVVCTRGLRWWSTNCEMRSVGWELLETIGRPGLPCLCTLGKM